MTSIKQLVVMLVLGIGIGPKMTRASTPAPTTCQQTWALTSGRNIAGGTLNASITTLGDCQAACIASPTCQSIDFAPVSVAGAGNQCWLSTSNGTTGVYVGNSHYDLTRAASSCSCVQTWVLTSGRNLNGGTVNAAATTLAACQAACLAQSTCQSIDFAPASVAGAGNQCWLNTATGTTGDYVGNGHYDLTRAPASCNVVATTTPAPSGSSCQHTWLVTADRNINGGTVNAAATTLAACQAACLAQSTCQSIDFAPLSVAGAGNQCWLSTGTGTTGAYVGNTHYDLTRAPAACTCAQSWVQTNGRNLNGGTVSASITTLTDCQAACIASTTCQSIDFAPASVSGAGNQCWLSTGQGTTGTYVGNNHYDLTRANCPSATSQTPGGAATTPSPTNCQQTWLPTADRNINGGTVNAAITTLAACQAACIAQSTCQSIDFAPVSVAGAGNQCWLSTGTGTTGAYVGNTHYDLTRPASTSGCSSGGGGGGGSTCSVWYVMGGGVVNVDPATNRLVVSNTIRQVTCFNSNPCVASSLAGFNFTAPSNCISLSPYNTPGSFARFDWYNLVLQQQAGQAFPQRFVQDASFLSVQNALMPGYISLQPVFANPNVTYYFSALPDTTIQPFPAATINPSQASFVLSPLQPQPNVVTTATCANVWSRIDEVVGSRNVLVGNTTRAVCRQQCLVTPYCVGVSYNYLTTTCYLETRLPNSPTVSLSFMAGYSYFELNTAFPAPCTPGSSYTFLSPASTNLVNVTTNVSTINHFQCRQNCLNSGLSCLGINYQQGNCTLVSPGGNVTITLANYQAFVLASKFGGPCCPAQVSVLGFNDPQAVLQSGITTFDACFTACSNALQCYAFDFYNNLCYFSQAPITAVSGPTLTALAGALHIDLLQSPCGAGCRDKWDSYLETTASNMTLATGISNGMACRQLCQSTPTCTVVSWNYQNNTCTTGTSASVRTFPGTSPGWRTYQLSRLAYCDQDYP